MYRQGLGDCFLLTFKRDGEADFNMMIDCGLFLGTPNGKEIMTMVAENIQAETSSRLNVVLMTHEHWDHISGFSLAKEVFDDADFKFDEVWVGWTENEADPKFTDVRERFRKKKRGLRAALHEMKSKTSQPLKQTINSLVNEFFGEDEEAGLLGMSGANTWKYVLEKSLVQPPRYCAPGQIQSLQGVDGVRVYILGPPEDFELLDDEESPEAETYRKHLRMALADSFFAAATSMDDADFDTNTYLPFDDKYKVAYDEAEDDLLFGGFYRDSYGFAEESRESWRRIDEDWLSIAGDLALNIDGITNNTCLAIAIELVESKKVMIFPGDAQFGNWISWQKLKWEVLEPNGERKEVNATDLLKRTVLYKVGHHGSHNATLRKSGLELMESPELVAMIPTNQDFAKTKNKDTGGWKMPEKELMERLEQKAKGRVILADESGPLGNENKHLKERCKRLQLSSSESDKFLKNIAFGGSFARNRDFPLQTEPLYVDYTIEG